MSSSAPFATCLRGAALQPALSRTQGSLRPSIGALAVLLTLASFGLSACGDDDDGDGGDGNAGSSAAGKDGAGHGPRDAGGKLDAAAADASVPAPACDVVPPTQCEAEPPYAEIESIIEQRCVGCHDGRGEEWALTSQAHVASWFNEIRVAMSRCTMPPPASGLTMPTAERELILQWLYCKF
jgi:hypothetical protein